MNKLFVFCCFAMFALLTNTSALSADNFNVETKYSQSCAVCHTSGVAGAPKKGDTKTWTQRLAKGDAALLASVKKGKGAMPAKGMCADCTDDQFKALIHFMAK